MHRFSILITICIIWLSACQPQDNQWIIQAPAETRPTKIDKNGETILPNGRIIKPYGKTFTIAPHPFGLVLSPDGQHVVTANSGINPISISILRNIFSKNPPIQQIPEGAETDKGILAAVFMGLAIPKTNDLVYVAGGQENTIYIFNLKTGAKLDSIDCKYKNDSLDFTHGYIGDLHLNQDGSRLYAVDQINFRFIIIDTKSKQVLENVAVGRYPFGITLSPDEQTAYVANVGMYAYDWISSFDKNRPKETALQYPPFAYQSKESIEGIDTDSFKVPGLGDPNAPESFSVWAINLQKKQVTAKVKTGILVGEKLEEIPAVGGSSPNSLAATEKYVFISNGNNDCISVIDNQTNKVIKNIYLKLDERLGNWRGVIPFGLALSPDKKKLFIAEAGINAVGVIDVEKLEVIGHIPVGWFPSKLAVSPDGKKLVVANAKGYGSGPNGGAHFKPGAEGSYIGSLMKGSVTVFDIPNHEKLKALTKEVVSNNFHFIKSNAPDLNDRQENPVPLFPKAKESPIKHIVFISKENRTYDEVFGQLKNGNGDSTLARFGYNATFSNYNKKITLNNVTVMPNHLALARQFAISDNFYVDSDVSADGHRWLVCTYPNEWVETSVAASYGGLRQWREGSKAKGNFVFDGASGAIYPEDYNEAGSMWEHLERNGIPFWNFGFGTMFAPHLTDDLAYQKGYAYAVNYPVPAPLFANTSRIYPTYNIAIPDLFRIEKFKEEFNAKWMNGKEKMPSMLTLIIGNDHGAGERPEAGYPFLQSYMADNDLALGRLVEFLSQTPYWKNMAIVVTEDDAQGGVDHVDAHRSLLMVISPYAKRDFVGHSHSSFGSIFKTFWNILGIPHLNQYDAGAADLAELFTNEPNFTSYKAIAPDARLFNPQKAYDPLDAQFDWSALSQAPAMDDVEYVQKQRRK